jgi:large subunit ribosomal protein L22
MENISQDKIAFARSKAIKTSPQKLNLVAKEIRKKGVEEAVLKLLFCKKKVAKDVLSVLNSAIANAENNQGLDVDNLYISEIAIGKAFVMKRFRARARGRAGKILKPFSNLKITVKERD